MSGLGVVSLLGGQLFCVLGRADAFASSLRGRASCGLPLALFHNLFQQGLARSCGLVALGRITS